MEIIPLFGIFMIIAIVVGPMWLRFYYRSRERAALHETLRLAYEKGQPPPPELIEKLAADGASGPRLSTPENDMRRGVVLIALGIGLLGLGLGLGYGIGGHDGAITAGSVGGAGAIPGLVGIAYLILWLGGRKRPAA